MSDIVERLRQHKRSRICQEAAEEIERLHKLKDDAVEFGEAVHREALDEGERLRLDERLRAEINQLAIVYRDDKIERLKAALRDCSENLEEWVENHYRGTQHYPDECRRYERDIEPVRQARAALE